VNIKLRSKWGVACVSVIMAAVLAALFFLLSHVNNKETRPPVPIIALQHIDLEAISPIPENILALNPLREQAGLETVNNAWKVVRCGMRICDGPSVTVLVNERKEPAKVILILDKSRGWTASFLPNIREYDIAQGKLLCKAADWQGTPPTLFKFERYQKNKLNGLTVYYSKDGKSICACEYRNNMPWTGRVLERSGFDSIRSDVSFKEGKLHGEQRRYQDGKLDRLTMFKNSVKHGVEKIYLKGRLRSETTWENGICRHYRSWYQNGQLEAEEYQDAEGRRQEFWMWDYDGVLELEEHYRNGKRHGRRWGKSQRNVLWYWDGKCLGGGDFGKAEFDKRNERK